VTALQTRERLRRFLSISFDQPLGAHIDAQGLNGYYLDMRVKATSPRWPSEDLPPLDRALHQVVAQWGLGAYEHFLESGREEWLEGARAACGFLLDEQTDSGPLAGGWPHQFPFWHTFDLEPGWLSGMAQGEGASLLVRVHAQTGEERLAEAARAALGPLTVPSSQGGVGVEMEGGPFFEEYPTAPPSMVLNGGIFAIWGVRDVAVALEDGDARLLLDAALDGLAAGIGRWDLGYWSRYDLFPHRRVNVASEAYHELHIDQLAATNRIAPRPALLETEARWRRYRGSALKRARAFAAKAAFRLAVPRQPPPSEPASEVS
jgi:heparosan-N-sulfate-glucuronate 5-epimerase